MKTRIVTLSTPGAVASVHCNTHGVQKFVAGCNAPMSKEPQRIRCPHCREVEPAGKDKVGSSFIDSSGVLYVVDVDGSYRVASKLTDQQKSRIQEARNDEEENE